MTIRIFGLMGLGALALAACGQAGDTPAQPPAPADAPVAAGPEAAPAPPQGFRRDAAVDATGYYIPQEGLRIGDWSLKALSIGPPEEFPKWEAGERTATYAPVMFEFEDVTSPVKENELGQPYHTVSVRVLPTAYRVEAGTISFTGTEAKLGNVIFDGALDMKALEASKAAGSSTGPVVTGGLEVGGERIRNLGLAYFIGD